MHLPSFSASQAFAGGHTGDLGKRKHVFALVKVVAMKKVLKFVKGKKEERKDGGGVTPSQSGDPITSPAETPEDEKFLGLDNPSGYFNGKDKTLTKLHKAAWQGSLEKLKSALKKVDVDAVDRRNRTALHFAVVQGHPNIVWFLLGNNAKATVPDDEGHTPLLKAIECGHRECMTLLLERGADVNVADYTGNTGLHIAAKQGSLDFLTALLNKGADTEVSNNAGDYPLHMATKLDNKDLVDVLLDAGAAVDVQDRENRTPLMLAAKMGNLSLVRLFVERGAQLNIVDSNGWAAEDYALLSDHEKVAALLKSFARDKKEKERECRDAVDGNGSWSDSQPEGSSLKDPIATKLREFFKKEGDKKKEEKEEELLESPNAEDMPPYCQPPRSWEMIQAGMIDEKKGGGEPKRRSITILGTLHSRRESFTEALSTSSPKHTLSLNRRKAAKVNNFAKQRFSFNEEESLRNWMNDEKIRKDLEKMELENILNIESAEVTGASRKEDSTSESEWDSDFPVEKSEVLAEGKQLDCESIDSEAENKRTDSGTFGRTGTMNGVEEIWMTNPRRSPAKEDSRNSWDSEEASLEREGSFPPPPSALELGVDMAKSIKYMKGVSEDRPTFPDRNMWKNAYESHSLDCLDEKETEERSKATNFKGHFRHQSTSAQKWGSEEIQKSRKANERLRDVNKRINEELECYDQALRELAESSGNVSWSASNSGRTFRPQSYHSLPVSREERKKREEELKTENVPRKIEMSRSGPSSAPCDFRETRDVENNETLGTEHATTKEESVGCAERKVGRCPEDKETSSSGEKKLLRSEENDESEWARDEENVRDAEEPVRSGEPEKASGKEHRGKLEKKTKRHMLLAMREVKHAVHVTNTFRTSLDEQVLSPLTKPENGSFENGEPEGSPKGRSSGSGETSPAEENPFFGLGRQETVMESRRKSSSSGTGDDSTLWLQDEVRKDFRCPESDEDASEISADANLQRHPTFSPLGVVHREIERESQSQKEGATAREPIGEELRLAHYGCEDDDEDGERNDEVVREPSPDVSLSSGPIEPLGTEKDSGSDPETSHNDLTPSHRYSLKAQHEWLKCHLKTATTEKNKLEEMVAQLSEKAERLQYELADAREASKSRDEVIQLLQGQLAKMEAAYTKSLEESVQSRLQLTSHEQEILHLKELCFKYQEEDREATGIPELETRIKILEEEKERLKKDLARLEREKASLEKRLKEVLADPEILDQCQRWKERCEKCEEGAGNRESKEAAFESYLNEVRRGHADREKQLLERISDLEKKYLEASEENIELIGKIRGLATEMEAERKKLALKSEIGETVSELKRKNADVEVQLRRLEKEVEERSVKKLEDEVRESAKREKDSLIAGYERKLMAEREIWRKENERLKDTIKCLQDRVLDIEKKTSKDANETLKNEISDLKDQCCEVSKSIAEMQLKDQEELGFLMKENFKLKGEVDELRTKVTKDAGDATPEDEEGREKLKGEILELKNQVNLLTAMLDRDRRLLVDSNRRNASLERRMEKVGMERRQSHKSEGGSDGRSARKADKEDELAWSNLYGIKGTGGRTRGERTSMSEALRAFEGNEDEEEEEEGRIGDPEILLRLKAAAAAEAERDKDGEFTELRREIVRLRSRMTDEKALRRSLEHRIAEIDAGLREKQSLQKEISSLKRKMDADCLRRSEMELLRYGRELESRREQILGVREETGNADEEYKRKCEVLAKERQKTKEVKEGWRKWKSCGLEGPQEPSATSTTPVFSVSPPVRFNSYPRTLPEMLIEPVAVPLTLNREIKNKLEEELERSIRKYINESSSTQSISAAQMGLLSKKKYLP